MNIGFYIPRDNNIKLFGPLVDLLLENNCNVTLFCDYTQTPSQMGYKAYQFPAVEKVPKFKRRVNVVPFRGVAEFGEIIREEKIEVCFFTSFPGIARELKTSLKKQNYSIVIAELQHYYDLLLWGKDISDTDVIYCYSRNWAEWWKEYIVLKKVIPESAREEFFRDIEKKCVAVGFPEADQVKDFKAEEIRKKHRIPSDKKVVLLIPFPFRLSSVWINCVYTPQPVFLKKLKLMWHKAEEYLPDVYKKIDDFEVAKAIRKFCDQNDAVLVVKGRAKNPIPRYLRKMADFVFLDESFYPFTTLELLFISSLTIAYCSMTILESALMGIPSVCIIPKHGKLWPGYEPLEGTPDFQTQPGSFYNFGGVVFNENVESFVSGFPRKTFEDYRLCPEKKKDFVEKFLGFDDYSACRRIYKDLQKRLGSQKI